MHIHTGEYMCEITGKTMCQSTSDTAFKNTNREKPFMCELCEKVFSPSYKIIKEFTQGMTI